MILYILTTAICILAVVSLCSIPKVIELYRTAQHVKLTINNSYLPDYVIEREQPIRFPVGEQYLLLQPLSIQKYEVYVNAMIAFFKRYQNYLQAVNIDSKYDELDDDSVADLISLFKNEEASTDFLKIVSNTILRDKTINPYKITTKQLKRKLTFTQLIQLFVVLYDRNVTSVESFIHCLLKQLAVGGESAKAGCGLWSLQNLREVMLQIGALPDNRCGSEGGEKGSIETIKSLPSSKIKKVSVEKTSNEDVDEDV